MVAEVDAVPLGTPSPPYDPVIRSESSSSSSPYSASLWGFQDWTNLTSLDGSRSETLGLCLAAFSTALPYIGKFLKGEDPVDRSTLPEGNQQIFVMSDNLLDSQKEDFAWASYVILRNTNTMSVLIIVQEASCVRGYWNMPEDISKVQVLELLRNKFEEAGFLDLNDTLYFPESPDFVLQQMLPKGTLSLLVQPVSVNSSALDDDRTNVKGFLLLASSANYAYSDKDLAWIRAISNKFLGIKHAS